MALHTGARLGPYEIVAAIGAGGMGEVYRARDTRLDRMVALKVISSAIAGAPDLRQRFEREARSLSALNHPHICTLYDVGHEGETQFLVLEYVEGETLASRLERGPLAMDEVIRRGVELAAALDRAHRANVVHRDLKPANIMLTKAGVKVLDFGLARFKPQEPLQSGSVVTMQSPELTGQGTILGTLQYMSPEQLSGREVDARSDIFALGAVLYEMATGRRAFEAPSHAGLIASILEHDPPPIAVSGKPTPIAPAALDRLVRRCLAKDPDDRWQSARDLVLELQALASGSGSAAAIAAPPRARSNPLPWIVAAAALAIGLGTAAGALWVARAPRGLAGELRLQVVTPATPSPVSLALSPDGRRLVFVAAGQDSIQAPLWLRDLDTVSSQALSGTEGATFPFWSADNRGVAFFADSKLQRYDLAGGGVQTLASAPLGRGGDWNQDGVIIFAPTVGPLFRMSASGGAPVALTEVNPPHQTSHRFPQFLPDGRRFIYFVQGNTEAQGIYLGSLDRPNGRKLMAADSRAVLAGAETLIFVRQGTGFAQRLDADKGTLVGEPIKVADQIIAEGAFNMSGISASTTGLIAYRSGSANELMWTDRTGKPSGSPIAHSDPPNCPELSPDGRWIAFDRTVNGNRDIWLLELARNVTRRFTFNSGIDATPLWSPDGSRIAFRSNRTGVNQVYLKATNAGAGSEERLPLSDLNVGVSDWSPDGQTLLFVVVDPKTAIDLWALRLSGDRKPFVVANTPFEERDAQFSPDGKWIAYASNESGRMEVYIQAFPQAAQKFQVSTTGGTQPRWRHDSRELFFVGAGGAMMASNVNVTGAGSTIDTGSPASLFAARLFPAQGGLLRHQYAVTADGSKFLLNAVTESTANAPITVIAHWRGFETIGKR